jgi:hypothetical protein
MITRINRLQHIVNHLENLIIRKCGLLGKLAANQEQGCDNRYGQKRSRDYTLHQLSSLFENAL